MGILGVVLYSGSLDLDRIIAEQAGTGVWNVFTQPLGFVVFMIAAFAESARLPFDLPECEQELIGGYHTEYAGMKLLLFLIAEFLHMVVGGIFDRDFVFRRLASVGRDGLGETKSAG